VLDELHIRDLGVVEDVTLRLTGGLNVLTGETGAGKTIIVSALELLRGARASAAQVRDGARAAVVEARVAPVPPAAGPWVDDDDELVVARELSASDSGSRSRARVGGRLAPVSTLAEVMGALVELHGQQDSTRLGTPAVQRGLLDRYGGAPLAAALDTYRAAHHAHERAREELTRLRTDERERARDRDRLRFELAEIDAVAPDVGEEHDVDARLRRLEHAERLVLSARQAAELLIGDDGARDTVGGAVAHLRGVAGVDPELDGLHERTERAASEVQDLGLELAAYAEGVELDPDALEAGRARRAALSQLLRKYGADTGEVVDYAKRAQARLVELEQADDRGNALAGQLEALRAAMETAAAALRDRRTVAARALEAAVDRHLDELAMPGARLRIEVTPTTPGADGADRIDYLLAANPGEPALELGRFASGGERSRIALALRLALADADDTPVLVFDEIDAGIGGAVARVVGEKLAVLARGRQVLCVTHSPQLAAHADTHFVVTKQTSAGRTRSRAERLDRDDRVRELSRMLSGSADSDLAVRHADELLDSAQSA
jgi:DNA repair protein RecN (Recombination protein N)